MGKQMRYRKRFRAARIGNPLSAAYHGNLGASFMLGMNKVERAKCIEAAERGRMSIANRQEQSIRRREAAGIVPSLPRFSFEEAAE